MGLPKKLTERQIKFAELLVYNEGRKSPSECAYEAGYKTRPRQAASELRNPKIAPLVVKYIGELRAEIQEKYGITFEKHIGELAKLREPLEQRGRLVLQERAVFNSELMLMITQAQHPLPVACAMRLMPKLLDLTIQTSQVNHLQHNSS